MLYPVKKKLVNWVDGMKISKDHFIQTEDYFLDIVRDTTSLHLTNYNYGLLPPYRGEKLSNDFEISERITNRIEIELRQCNAVTYGGCRIDINPTDPLEYLHLDYEFAEDADIDGKDENKSWDVVLIVQPFRRLPTGVIDTEETPPRYPDSSKSYALSIRPSVQTNSDDLDLYHLTIGRIKKEADKYVADSNYIPPCMSMTSHPDLKKYYELFGKYLNDIEVSSQKIVQKIQEKNNTSDVASGTDMLCKHLLVHIAGMYFNYKNVGRYSSPLEITSTFSSLAHTCYTCVNFLSKVRREELLQYYYEWADVKPGGLIDVLTKLMEMKYIHQDIRGMMLQIEETLSVLSSLWLRLSTLEYIGKHRENIVVAERVKPNDNKPRQSEWIILD